MDLILLQPGNTELLSGPYGASNWDVAGLSADDKWRDRVRDFGPCIEIISAHQGMKQQITTDVSNSARTSGRPVINDFTLTKYIDSSSVRLYDYCLRAEPLGKGAEQPTRLHLLRNTDQQASNFITFALRDAIISEIQLQTHPNDMPTEQFKLSFTEILWTYNAQQSQSKNAVAQTTGWSLLKNRPIEQFTR